MVKTIKKSCLTKKDLKFISDRIEKILDFASDFISYDEELYYQIDKELFLLSMKLSKIRTCGEISKELKTLFP